MAKTKQEIVEYYEKLYKNFMTRSDIYQNFFNENYKVLNKLFDTFEQLKFDDIKVYSNKQFDDSHKWIIYIKDIHTTDEAALPFLVPFSKMGFNIAMIQTEENEFSDFVLNTDEYLRAKLQQIIKANNLINTIDPNAKTKGVIGEGVGAFVGNWFTLNMDHMIKDMGIKFNISLSMVTDPLNFIKDIWESRSNRFITRKKFKKQIETLKLVDRDFLINDNNPLFNTMIPSFYIHAIDDQVASVLTVSEFLIRKYKKYKSSSDWKLIYNYGEHNNIAVQHFNDVAGHIFDFFKEKNLFSNNNLIDVNLNKEYFFDEFIEEKTELLVYFDKGDDDEKEKN